MCPHHACPPSRRRTRRARPGVAVAPLRPAGRPCAVRGPRRRRRRARARGRRRAARRGDRRHELVVVRRARARPPRPRRGPARAGRPLQPRHVRRPDPRAGGGAGRGARPHRPGPARARVLRGLRVGVDRGGAQARGAGPGGPRAPRSAAIRRAAGRLPRRHGRGDERLRPGGQHARVVPLAGARAGLPAAAARRGLHGRAPRSGARRGGRGLGPRGRGRRGRPRRRARGGRGRTRAAGGRGHVRLRPALPRGTAPHRRRARPAPGRRRDRHGVRPDRSAVRLRVGRRRTGRHVRRQGADRRDHDAGRGAVHRCGRGRRDRVAPASPDARTHVHGQPPGLRGRPGLGAPARRPVGRPGPGGGRRAAALARPGPGPGQRPGRPRARGGRRHRARRPRRRGGRHARGAAPRRVGPSLPLPRLHDAARTSATAAEVDRIGAAMVAAVGAVHG